MKSPECNNFSTESCVLVLFATNEHRKWCMYIARKVDSNHWTVTSLVPTGLKPAPRTLQAHPRSLLSLNFNHICTKYSQKPYEYKNNK